MTGGKTSDTTQSTESAVLKFIKGLRDAGVLKYKGWAPMESNQSPLVIDVELSMRDPLPFAVPNPAHFQHEPVNELDSELDNDDDIELPAKDMPVVRGRDGLTAEEQADLYGNVIDAVPRDGEE